MDDDRTPDDPEQEDGSEVLSFDMDRDDAGEIVDPAEEDAHLEPADPDAGFDGWLDPEADEDASSDDDASAEDEVDNPYDELGEEDPESVVSDWLAFARGEDDAPSSDDEAPEPDEDEDAAVSGGEDTGELPVVELTDDTGDLPVVDFEIEGPPDDDTGELPVVVDEGEPQADPEWGLEPPEPAEPDELDEVVELEAIAADEEAASPVEVADEGNDVSFDDFTADDYVSAATEEHAELAAAIAAAEDEVSAQVPLSAAIPGLGSSVVGFEDVVEEEEAEEEEAEGEPRAASNLALRVGTGLALLVTLGLCLLWRPALIVFVLAVFVVSAGEFYSALISRRYKPMSLFGFLGIAGAGLGTAAWGVGAIPVSLMLMATALLLFNAVSPRRDQPAANFSLTVLVAAWIGGLGAFAFDIIASEDYRIFVGIVVALVALTDIAAFFVGRSIGSRQLAPVISPNKTIEGFVAGTLTALAVGAGAAYVVEGIDLSTGLLLGAVTAVFAPLGDLAVSVVKRSLDIKDMGSILPGHGGLLDRIDAVITVIPAVWVVLTWLALI